MMPSNFRPMDWSQFQKLLKKHGCTLVEHSKASHFKIIDSNGHKITDACVSHKEGGKKFVKPPYVKQLLDWIEEQGG